MCKASEVPHADLIFNVVFLCTLLSLLIQGTSLSALAKKLHLTTPPVEQKKLLHFDIDLPEEVESVATEMEVTTEMLVNGNTLKDIKFDTQLLVIMVRRGEDFFVPTGISELAVGDQLLIISDSAAVATEQYLEESTAMVLPSFYREGVPMTLLEAASMGRILISTDNVGCRDAVDDGINGFLVPVKDHVALADAMRMVIEMSYEEKVAMGLAGRKKVENEFADELVVKVYEGVLKENLK
jgi:glycosyltransferase involved in cell wall biosynthesis